MCDSAMTFVESRSKRESQFSRMAERAAQDLEEVRTHNLILRPTKLHDSDFVHPCNASLVERQTSKKFKIGQDGRPAFQDTKVRPTKCVIDELGRCHFPPSSRRSSRRIDDR